MAEIDSPAARRKNPWGLTFFGLLAIGGLVAMPLLAGAPQPEKMPDLVRFFGRFHPVVLHLPIGVFLLIVVQELGAIFGSRRGDGRDTPMFPMVFGALSAILAVIAGFLLYHGEDYGDGAIVTRHLWGGLIFAMAAVVTLVVKSWTVARAGNPAFYRLLLFASVGVMGFVSHDGGTLTHGEGFLTKYAPEPLRKVVAPQDVKPEGAPAEPAAKVEPLVYADVVAPILERRCVQCHKEGKAKGKLRMDSFEMLVKGGKEGAAIEPGNSAKSLMIVRIELPKDDEEHMPPEGKPEVEAHELAVLKWWIDAGAEEKTPLAKMTIPAPIQEAISKLLPAAAANKAAAEAAPAAASGPDEGLKQEVAKLSTEFPGAVNFESQAGADVVFTAVSMRGSFDDAGVKKLEKLLPHLVSADLSATKVTDASVAMLAGAPKLRMLRLAETGVTDAAMDSLAKASALESLNLYGTKVTDVGIAKLAALPNLKRLYLWQTSVSAEAIKALKAKLPSCEIVTGASA